MPRETCCYAAFGHLPIFSILSSLHTTRSCEILSGSGLQSKVWYLMPSTDNSKSITVRRQMVSPEMVSPETK